MDERTATVNIGGQEYEMLLTTRATKAIAGRYGGLENLGEKLMKAENFEMALDEIVWLITLLCNQPILVHNLKHPEDKKPELTADEVELLTSPMELTDYKDAIPGSPGQADQGYGWQRRDRGVCGGGVL